MTATAHRSGDQVEAFLASLDAYEPRRLEQHEDGFRMFARFISRTIDARYLERHPPQELLPDLEHLMAAGLHRFPEEIRVHITVQPETNGRRGILTTCLPDQLFLFSSVRLSLETIEVSTFRWLNTVVPVRRDATGEISAIGQPDALPESFIWMEIEADNLDGRKGEIERYLKGRLEAARACVEDWPKIRGMVQNLTQRFQMLAQYRPDNRQAHENNARLLRWLLNNNFVFLGSRYLSRDGTEPADEVGNFGVGRFDDWRGIPIEDAERAVYEAGGIPPFLWVRKSKNESWIYRPGRTDHVLVQCYTEGERLAGLLVIEGLFSYEALAKPRTDIPLLDDVIGQVFRQLQATKGSHRYRTLRNAFNSLPLEYLFALQAEDVREILEQVLEVDAENRLQVHITTDELQNFAFVFVTLPRAHYSDELRSDVRKLLKERFRASSVDDGVYYGDMDSVAVHYFLTGAVRLDPAAETRLRSDIEDMASLWSDRLLEELGTRYEVGKARRLHSLYNEAFPTRYREETSMSRAVTDIEILESLPELDGFDCDIYRERADERLGVTRLRLYETTNLLLSDILPILDNFGLVVIDEFPTTVHVPGHPERTVATFRIRGVQNQDLDLLSRRNRLRAALKAVVRGAMDNEMLNRLLLRADIPWPYVSMVRAYQHYIRLLGFPFTKDAMDEAMLRHAHVLRAITELFRAKFDPRITDMSPTVDDRRQALIERSQRAVGTLLEGVSDLTDDQILRALMNLVEATVRSNFYAREPAKHPQLVLKFDPSQIERLSGPRLYREIYVHHPKVAGLHLRGGPVARGGIRWSNRQLDFRTEVLGLALTQNLKNVLIVPRGAKGAFVLRAPPAEPSRARAEADRMYRIFIGGLLEVTDHLVDGQPVAPDNVICYDPSDHYLVVAADKGTAHLSDVANDIAQNREFWLGDAFASGGSYGYDHKKEGITARGAWECVKRHFAEMGLNPERDPLRVVGIGDMSGDVFGNGMLRSRTLQVIAAFDHRHIFVDPNPDPERSYDARLTMFNKPGSTWAEYPEEALSPGAGVYARGAKAVKLSQQAQMALGIDREVMSGHELVQAVLQAPVDLLWNGGIGTYIKSAEETHLEVGDPPNDAVRVNADTVRAKVIGEGGNLGITPLGRIELAGHGTRLNTDAVDNSAGVDMSDHEVNLKILLGAAVVRQELGFEGRNAVLEEVKEQISQKVLSNNWVQSRMLSLDELRSRRDPARFQRAIDFLADRLNFKRREMWLPGERILSQRMQKNEGLYRPELACLAANAKLDLRQELIRTEVFDGERLAPFLLGYFPESIIERFEKDVRRHPLGVNIARTMLTNAIIGDAGATWLPELTQQTGRSADAIVNAYLTACDLLKTVELKRAIDGLEGSISCDQEYRLRLLVEDALENICSWLLRRSKPWGSTYSHAFDEALRRLPDLVSDEAAENFADLSADLRMGGVPQDLAEKLVILENVDDVLDIARLVAENETTVEHAGDSLFSAGTETGLTHLIDRAQKSTAGAGLERPARLALCDQLRRHRVEVAATLLLGSVRDSNGWLGELKHDLSPLLNGTVTLINLVIASDRTQRRLRAIGR